jgi:hypothetical protein
MSPTQRRGWKKRIRNTEYHDNTRDQVDEADTDGSLDHSLAEEVLSAVGGNSTQNPEDRQSTASTTPDRFLLPTQ